MSRSLPEACSTCALLLADTKLPYDSKSEKPIAHDRRLDCCGRIICGKCIAENSRFSSYCPFCQISSEPSPLLPQGLREPPAYSPPHTPPESSSSTTILTPPSTAPPSPPPYSSLVSDTEASGSDLEDLVHFLRPPLDNLSAVSLAYRIPGPILRRHNNLFTDTLLPARRFIMIPRSMYNGPSLSPEPVPGSQEREEEEKKTKVRRFMVRTKCVDYEITGLYLGQEEWDVERAVDRFKADERWEKEHPLQGKGKDKRRGPGWRRVGIGGGISGQLG